ncbi:MAG: VanZ family protein [Planctomycetota bacterium]
MRLALPLWLWRSGFAAYAILLSTATHWPRLKITGPVPRPDLWIHFTAFGLFTVALNLARPYRWLWQDPRAQTAMLAYAIAYAWVDESAQAIPGLGRTFDPADLAANTVGCLLGALVVAGLSRVCPAKPLPAATVSAKTSQAKAVPQPASDR